jgi:hypothetical protein
LFPERRRRGTASPVCLHKLHHLAARYRKLEAFYRRHGFGKEAVFVARRLSP